MLAISAELHAPQPHATPNLRLVHGLLPTLALLGRRRAHSGRGIPRASDVAAHLPNAANQAWGRLGSENYNQGARFVRGLIRKVVRRDPVAAIPIRPAARTNPKVHGPAPHKASAATRKRFKE